MAQSRSGVEVVPGLQSPGSPRWCPEGGVTVGNQSLLNVGSATVKSVQNETRTPYIKNRCLTILRLKRGRILWQERRVFTKKKTHVREFLLCGDVI